MLQIAGFQKSSTVDYPGKLAAVVFTPGCNMNCFYCHNKHIANHAAALGTRDEASDWEVRGVFQDLRKRSGFLEGLVVSGGEPTLQPGLERFILAARALGYAIKLDTNGAQPEVLCRLIRNGLVDYVAMDIKAPLRRYREVCGARFDPDDVDASVRARFDTDDVDASVRTRFDPDDADASVRARFDPDDVDASVRTRFDPDDVDASARMRFDPDDVDASVQVLLQNHVPCEFRTTVIPQLGAEDLLEMAGWIRGAKKYVLQQYRPLPPAERANDPRCAAPAHSPAAIRRWAEMVRPFVETCEVRGLGLESGPIPPAEDRARPASAIPIPPNSLSAIPAALTA